MTWMVSEMFSRFWIFFGILMFCPPNLYVPHGISNVWFFANSCTFLNLAWWMWIFNFELNQLLGTFCNLLYAYVEWAICKSFSIKHFQNSPFVGQFFISTKLYWNFKKHQNWIIALDYYILKGTYHSLWPPGP